MFSTFPSVPRFLRVDIEHKDNNNETSDVLPPILLYTPVYVATLLLVAGVLTKKAYNHFYPNTDETAEENRPRLGR